jgi:hypothetical protein
MKANRKSRSLDVTEEKIATVREAAKAAHNIVLVKHCDLASSSVDSFRAVLDSPAWQELESR